MSALAKQRVQWQILTFARCFAASVHTSGNWGELNRAILRGGDDLSRPRAIAQNVSQFAHYYINDGHTHDDRSLARAVLRLKSVDSIELNDFGEKKRYTYTHTRTRTRKYVHAQDGDLYARLHSTRIDMYVEMETNKIYFKYTQIEREKHASNVYMGARERCTRKFTMFLVIM